MDINTEKIKNALLEYEDIDIVYILLKGSKINSGIIDFWSDTDLVLVLAPEVHFEEVRIESLIQAIGPTIGQEIHQDATKLLLRLVVDWQTQIELLDLAIYQYKDWLNESQLGLEKYLVLHGDWVGDQQVSTSTPADFEYDKKQIGEVWLRYFLCVKKFMRNDNLIGLHLLFSLWQEYLVIEMIERDQKRGTNVHRFGGQEKLPVILDLSGFNYSNKRNMLRYIRALGFCYDQKLMQHFPIYQSRMASLNNYLIESEKQIEDAST